MYSSSETVKNYTTSPAIATMTECYQPSATSSAELINSCTEKTVQNQSIDKGASVKPKMAKTFVLNDKEEDVLDLEDGDHMSLESAGKRMYETEYPLEEIKNAKPKREPPVNMDE